MISIPPITQCKFVIPLPGKEMAMRVTNTKQQLIEIARNDLIKNNPAKLDKLIITVSAEATQVRSNC